MSQKSLHIHDYMNQLSKYAGTYDSLSFYYQGFCAEAAAAEPGAYRGLERGARRTHES